MKVYDNAQKKEEEEIAKDLIDELPSAEVFIKDTYLSFDFLECIENIQKKSDIIRFYFILKIYNSNIFEQKEEEEWIVLTDGKLSKYKEGDEDRNNTFFSTERKEALTIKNRLYEKIKKICINYNLDDIIYSVKFEIRTKCSGKPQHLFTKRELEEKMRIADDRNNNRLVIDENGFIQILSNNDNDDLFNAYDLFPVALSQFCAGNNYVGKFFPSTIINTYYEELLYGWKEYLQKKKNVYIDDYLQKYDTDKLEEDIHNILKSMDD